MPSALKRVLMPVPIWAWKMAAFVAEGAPSHTVDAKSD